MRQNVYQTCHHCILEQKAIVNVGCRPNKGMSSDLSSTKSGAKFKEGLRLKVLKDGIEIPRNISPLAPLHDSIPYDMEKTLDEFEKRIRGKIEQGEPPNKNRRSKNSRNAFSKSMIDKTSVPILQSRTKSNHELLNSNPREEIAVDYPSTMACAIVQPINELHNFEERLRQKLSSGSIGHHNNTLSKSMVEKRSVSSVPILQSRPKGSSEFLNKNLKNNIYEMKLDTISHDDGLIASMDEASVDSSSLDEKIRLKKMKSQ